MSNYNILEEFEEAPYLAFYLRAVSFSITITQGYFRRHSWLVFGPEVTFFATLRLSQQQQKNTMFYFKSCSRSGTVCDTSTMFWQKLPDKF